MVTNVAATSMAGNHACFIHQALCSPPTPTLLWALVQSYELMTIPGLTPHLILHHLPSSTAMDKGHMHQHHQGVQTTRTQQPASLQARSNVGHLQPTKELCPAHDIIFFAALADLHTVTMYTNSTGAFPMQSFRNMQYMFVVYIYDPNAILVHAMPSKNDGSMIAAFTDILADLLNTCGYAPIFNVTDNECSKAIKAHI